MSSTPIGQHVVTSASTRGPLVSVVTPFHNTAEYLRECIESVLAQTLKDFEYILADNGSSDGSSDIAKEYAEQDSRIRYMRFDDVLPQIENYNRALTFISPGSTYCKIVQADDWILPSCLQDMTMAGEKYPTSGLISAYEMTDTGQVRLTGIQYPEDFIEGRGLCRRSFLNGLFVFSSPNTVMYRSAEIRQRSPFFNELSPIDDVDVGFDILQKADFSFVHQVLTGTRRTNVSAWSELEQFDPVPLHRLIALARYGPHVLTKSELRQALDKAEGRHAKVLANGVLALRGRKYWKFHQEGLAFAGLKIKRSRLAMQLLLLLSEKLLSVLGLLRLVCGWLLRVARFFRNRM